MYFNRIIIIFFVTSLFSFNVLWAAEGQLDNLLDSVSESTLDNDNDTLHHIEDDHHGGHDCHMSAHLLGLNSQILSLADFNSVQLVPAFDLRFSSRALPPAKQASTSLKQFPYCSAHDDLCVVILFVLGDFKCVKRILFGPV